MHWEMYKMRKQSTVRTRLSSRKVSPHVLYKDSADARQTPLPSALTAFRIVIHIVSMERLQKNVILCSLILDRLTNHRFLNLKKIFKNLRTSENVIRRLRICKVNTYKENTFCTVKNTSFEFWFEIDWFFFLNLCEVFYKRFHTTPFHFILHFINAKFSDGSIVYLYYRRIEKWPI